MSGFDEVLSSGDLAAIYAHAGRLVLDDPTPDAVRLLRDVLPDDPGPDFDPQPYLNSQTWVYAASMPTNPHEYCLLRKSSDWRTHLVVVHWIRLHGYLERFGGQRWRCQDVGGHHYWAGWDPNWSILNRKKLPGAASVKLTLDLEGL